MGVLDFLYDKRFGKRARLALNKTKGKVAETFAIIDLAARGYIVEKKIHKGGDFVAIKRDLITGKVIDRKIVEVKAGGSRLSPAQEKLKRRMKRRYMVLRYEFV